MAEQKKMVEAITPMDEDFAKWYTDIVKKAELMDYSSVRGCMVIEPYGYAIWENITRYLDDRFKELGHENVSMPLFIPESLLQKEKDHVEGFAPEVAWVTMGGQEKLEENFRTLIGAIIKAKPAAAKGQYLRNLTLASTMGPGVRVNPLQVEA